MELVECEKCGREWDGHAQCDCYYYYSSEDEYEQHLKDASTQTKRNRWGPKPLSKLEIAQRAVDDFMKNKQIIKLTIII